MTVKCYDSPSTYNTHIKDGLEYEEPYGDSKSAIYIHGATGGVTSSNSEYANCYLGEDGGVFHLLYTTFQDTNSYFHDNVGLYGSVFRAEY